MFLIKKITTFLLLLIIIGCTSKNFVEINPLYEKVISFDIPNDQYNVLLKEYLERNFNNKMKVKPDFILKANISFNSNETLSVSGLNVLNSTKAVVKYSLIDYNSNLVIKSDTIKTFPALSSSSSSIYSKEKSLEHIKERLTLSSANKLYILTKMNLRKLN